MDSWGIFTWLDSTGEALTSQPIFVRNSTLLLLSVIAGAAVAELPPLTIFEPDFVPESYDLGEEDEMEITRDGAVFVCESEWLWRLVGRVNFEDRDSLAYFQRMLRTKGIIDQLIAAGVKDGDTVRMYDFEFDFLT